MAKNLVCGMELKPEKAAASAQFNGQVYYFCSTGCKQTFDRAPEKYTTTKPAK